MAWTKVFQINRVDAMKGLVGFCPEHVPAPKGDP
jgi:hypothetical protein